MVIRNNPNINYQVGIIGLLKQKLLICEDKSNPCPAILFKKIEYQGIG